MINNLVIALMAMLVYVVYWSANLVASLVLNLAVIGEDWNKEKFVKSLWRLLGMLMVVILLTVGLSLASTETITMATLTDLIYVAAFTRLAEAITKVKDMFGYKATEPEAVQESEEPEKEEKNDAVWEG